MTTHTPGPWETRRTGNAAKDISIFVEGDAPSSGCICKLPHRDGREATVQANATLIAAAPDLLSALRRVMDADPDDLEAIDACEAAIAKAEGRS